MVPRAACWKVKFTTVSLKKKFFVNSGALTFFNYLNFYLSLSKSEIRKIFKNIVNTSSGAGCAGELSKYSPE